MFTGVIPDKWNEIVRSEVEPTESVRWFGQPRPWRFMLFSLPIVLFAIPWTAFALFWIYGAAGNKIPDLSRLGPETLFPLFGVPFVLIGIGLLLSPLFAYRAAKKTGYVITEKRVLVIHRGWFKTVHTYSKDQLKSYTRREGKNGRGDIILNGQHTYSGRHHSRREGLIDVEDVREVESHILSLIR